MKKPNKSKLQRVNSSMSVMLFTAFEFDRIKKCQKITKPNTNTNLASKMHQTQINALNKFFMKIALKQINSKT